MESEEKEEKENLVLLKRWIPTNYTGQVTVFLVNLVVSVNEISFFFSRLKQYHYCFQLLVN